MRAGSIAFCGVLLGVACASALATDVVVYDDASQDHLLDAFREQAGDARLSLSWFDAGVLSRKAIEQATVNPVDEFQQRGRIPEAS